MENKKCNLLLRYTFEKLPPSYREYLELLKDVYDTRFYHYGDHFKYHYEKRQTLRRKIGAFKNDLVIRVTSFKLQKSNPNQQPAILSTVYFNVDHHFKTQYDITVSQPPWAYTGKGDKIFDNELYQRSNRLRDFLQTKNFSSLITEGFFKEIDQYKEALKAYINRNNFVALCLAHDTGFFEKITIKAFKELGLPTFIFVHGLQFWQNELDFNRGDYMVVWGELSKNDFIENGMDPNKIIISGHPKYKIDNKLKPRFSLERVLVLSNSLNGITPSEDYILSDRSNCIYYLNLIKDSLVKMGVQSFTLRPHPSENPEWYKKYLDPSFFVIDERPLTASLSNATVVIGPASTVFLDALQHQVNYVVFNPENQSGKGLNGLRVPSIFNGGDQRVPVAKNPEELEHILLERRLVDTTIMKEIIAETFSLEDVNTIIRDHTNKKGN